MPGYITYVERLVCPACGHGYRRTTDPPFYYVLAPREQPIPDLTRCLQVHGSRRGAFVCRATLLTIRLF